MISDRYSGIFKIDKCVFHILGCGGIGSCVAINLARMGGERFYLYDMDTVELVNVGTSAFALSDIGNKKVNALSAIVSSINPRALSATSDEKFEEITFKPDNKGRRSNFVVMSFDSMASRLEAVKRIVRYRVAALIDLRMGSETFQMYTFLAPTLKQYVKHWYSDEDGDNEPCNARATSYCGSMAASFAANAIRKIVTKQPLYEVVIFDYPSMMLSLKDRKQ